MTAARCDECRDAEAVAGQHCDDCLQLVASDGQSCESCGATGIPASGLLLHVSADWRRYLDAVEDANGWPRGVLQLTPLVSVLDDACAAAVCTDCVSYCDGCSEPFACRSCADDCCASRCDECGSEWDDPDDAAMCCTLLHDYNYAPLLTFRSTDASGAVVTHAHLNEPRGVLFMGVELETEHAASLLERWYRDARENYDAPRFVYCKRDGSLDDSGVEFVSMPATLDAFRSMWPWDAFARLNAAGARSWFAGCGLHVHVARSAFMDAQHLARFVLLQYRNRTQCVALAGRESDQWASWDTTELMERGALPDFVKGKRDGARYRALNFQNCNTVELRYFRGNLRKAGLLRVLEFVAAAHEYTRDLSSGDAMRGALDWLQFARWIRSNRTHYPYAAHWMTTNNKKGN